MTEAHRQRALWRARHAKVCEMAARGRAHPEAEGAARAATQLVDDERRLGPVVHEHADLRPLDDDANVKPLIPIGFRDDGLFVHPGTLRSELLPGPSRMGRVLHGVTVAR